MNDVLKWEKMKILFLIIFLLIVNMNSKKANLKELNKLKEEYKQSSTNDEMEIVKPNIPLKKLNSTEEELIPVISINANSTYIKFDKNKNIIKKYDAKNLISEEFWCSSGNHGTRELISLKVEFESSTRLSALWLHWAYAPGEFRIRYSNNKEEESYYKDIFPKGFRYTIEKGNLNWWKKILSNPLTRWKHKSFDDRIELERPVFAKYVEIIMRIPVNQYFGLYKIEFYKKVKSIAMIKSKIKVRNLCMLISNGEFIINSPIIAKNCIDSLSLGDNRDLFIINSNGFITAYAAANKCIQSPISSKVELEDCSTAEQYKDSRHKWTFEPNGLIRSVKDPLSCLSVNNNDDNYIKSEQMTVKSTSTEIDNTHKPEYTINYQTGNFWASEPTQKDVIFSISFNNNLAFLLKSVKIEWKFPAKKFQIFGLLSDGNWKDFYTINNNRDITTEHSLMNSELKGIKLNLIEASMRVEGKNIYAIMNIFINLAGNYIIRQKCTQLLDDANLWEIVDVNYVDSKNAIILKKDFSKFQNNINYLKKIQKVYEEIPKKLMDIMESSQELINKLKDVDDKMSNIKSRLLNFENIISSLDAGNKGTSILGFSPYYPAMDCTHIKIAFPHKRSGFYWIKTECMGKPLKIFCDFYINKNDEEMTSDFHFLTFNTDENNFPLIKDIKEAKSEEFVFEIKRKCAEFGFEPLEIKSKEIFKRVQFLVEFNEFKFDLENKIIFPIAYAFEKVTSETTNVNQKYNSLNKSNSFDVKTIDKLETDLDPDYKDDKTLASLYENMAVPANPKLDVIAFSTDLKLIYTQFQVGKVNGIVCSSNQLVKINPKVEFSHHPELKCETTFRSEPFTSKDNFSSVIVECPKNCGGVYKSIVYGKGPYTDHSSICRAAIHSGVISDVSGGIIKVNLTPGLNKYEASISNQIESQEYSQKYSRSFVIEEYKTICPIDNFEDELKLYQNSLSQNVDKNSDNSLINANSVTNTNISSFILMDEIVNLSSNIQNTKDESNDEMKLLLRFLQTQYNSNKNFVKSHINNKEKENLNSLVSYVPHSKEMTTDEAKIDVKNNLESKIRLIKNAEQLTNTLKELVSNVQNQLVIYKDDSTRGIRTQLDYFSSKLSKIEDITKLIEDIDHYYWLKLIKAEHDFYELKKKIDTLQKRENYQEDFTNDSILTNYRIFNSLKGIPKEKTAEWSYFTLNLKGHNKVIVQNNRFTDDRTGSHLIIKNRDFYDFEFRCSVFISKGNMDTFGIAFRYLNEFTYYVFEMSRQEKGYKRIRRFIKGTPKIIDFKYDGGYNNDEWIYIKIRAEVGNIRVYMTSSDESINNIKEIDSRFVKVFDVYDNTLTHGTIAFTSLGLHSILLDDISLVQVTCNDFLADRVPIDIESNNCSRYRENFRHMSDKYKTYDPLKYEDGPSIWKRTRNYEHRRVLEQTSRIYGLNEQEEGTMNILLNNVCRYGKVNIKAKSVEDVITTDKKESTKDLQSSIGIIFKFIDENNYYILEISKDYFRLRKKLNGYFHLLKINNTIGYQPNIWFKVELIIKNNKFNAFFYNNIETSIPVKVFDEFAVDNTHTTGQVGFWTYATAAVFSGLELLPLEGEKLLLVDEKQIDSHDLTIFNNMNKLNKKGNKNNEKFSLSNYNKIKIR